MTRFNGGCGFISSLSNLVSNSPFLMRNSFYNSNPRHPMFSLHFFLALFTLSLLCLLFLSFSLYRRQRRKLFTQEEQNLDDPLVEKQSLSTALGKLDQTRENEPVHLTHSLLLEILPSDSHQWATLFAGKGGDDPAANGSGSEDVKGPGLEREKRKKKRAKRKKANLQGDGGGSGENKGNLESGGRVKEDLVCLYPFTSTGSATQRKIKQQYDQLMKCNESKGLTLAQVGEFANCLIEARNELQHKSEVIQRKFTITKVLLLKADRSSFDRLRQQIYKLELEQKRLEEDAFVYNWLQQQLKLSPAYKKMVEISENMELKSKSEELIENRDAEFADISFEELLAQEKKDSFWVKNGKARQCTSR